MCDGHEERCRMIGTFPGASHNPGDAAEDCVRRWRMGGGAQGAKLIKSDEI